MEKIRLFLFQHLVTLIANKRLDFLMKADEILGPKSIQNNDFRKSEFFRDSILQFLLTTATTSGWSDQSIEIFETVIVIGRRKGKK